VAPARWDRACNGRPGAKCCLTEKKIGYQAIELQIGRLDRIIESKGCQGAEVKSVVHGRLFNLSELGRQDGV
jgi:hypothetical protein